MKHLSALVSMALALASPLTAQEPTLRDTLKGHATQVLCVAISSDGKLLASGDKAGFVKLWDVATGKEKAILKVSTGHVRCVTFSGDSKLLATGAYEWRKGDEVFPSLKLWDVASGKEKVALKGHVVGHYVNSVAFSADGKLLASGSDDWTAKLWDVATGKEKASLKHPGSVTVAFSPEGKVLATGCQSNYSMVRLWDVETGKETASFEHRGSNVHSLAFSGDGKLLASAGNPAVRLWDVAAKSEKATLKNDGDVLSVAITSDGKLLASADSVAKAVRLWDVAMAKETAKVKGMMYYMALSTDGRLLVTVSLDGQGETLNNCRFLKLWDIPVAKSADK